MRLQMPAPSLELHRTRLPRLWPLFLLHVVRMVVLDLPAKQTRQTCGENSHGGRVPQGRYIVISLLKSWDEAGQVWGGECFLSQVLDKEV